jgi:hypothetical protein
MISTVPQKKRHEPAAADRSRPATSRHWLSM